MQVSAVLGLLGGAIRGLLHTLLEEGDISNEQGCALIQGMVCLANIVKQQRRSRNLQHKSDPHTFRFDTQSMLQVSHQTSDLVSKSCIKTIVG